MKSNDVTSEEPDNESKAANIQNVPGSHPSENDANMVDQLPHIEAIGKHVVTSCYSVGTLRTVIQYRFLSFQKAEGVLHAILLLLNSLC